MAPRRPVPHLVVGRARLPLGTLKAFLNPVRRLGHARQFRERRLRFGVREVVIMLERTVSLEFAGHEQQLLRARAPRLGSRLHPALHDLDHQRAFLAVANLDPGPGVLGQRHAPSIQPQERAHGMAAAARVFRGRRVQVADRRVRRHCQQVTFGSRLQFPAKLRRTAHLVVAGDPAVRQVIPALVEHLQGESVAGAELDLLGHARFLAAGAVLRPILGKVRTCIDQCMFLPRHVSHEDADLAIVDLAVAAAPLPRHADTLGPLLGERRGVENEHGIGFAQVLADLTRQAGEQRRMVPRRLADELLQALAFLVVKVGDRLAGLAFEFGRKTRHVLGGMPPSSRPGERLRERFEPLQKAPHQLSRDLSLGRHLFQANLVAPFHGRLHSGRLRHGRA